MPKTFSIVYGFAEGRKIGKKLTTCLIDAGLTEAPIGSADIIIAHSGGCYLLPEKITAKKVMLVGLSTWSDVNLLVAHINKVRSEPPTLSKFLWNAYYAASRPKTNWRMCKNKTFSEPKNTVIVRNEHDVYFPKNKIEGLKKKNYKVVELSGYHDDIWDNPDAYLGIALS